MHGIIFSELRKYVDTKLGSEAWNQLLAASELGKRMYLPIQEYPDTDMVALVTTASKTLGVPAEAILEDFGHFIAPSLVGLYRTLVKPEWKTLDLLENTENTIHSVVRARNPGARPAQLHAVRTGPDTVDLTYRSERRLCAVAKGILKGLGDYYGEQVTITETMCMHRGGEACRMEVRVGAAVKAEIPPGTRSTAPLRKVAAAAPVKEKAPRKIPVPKIVGLETLQSRKAVPKLSAKTRTSAPRSSGSRKSGAVPVLLEAGKAAVGKAAKGVARVKKVVSPGKAAVVKKTPATKGHVATKAAPANNSTPERRTRTMKKSPVKKAATKVAKKAAPKKPAGRKPAAKKPAVRKLVVAEKRVVAKAPAKKAVAKKAVAKKPVAKKAPVKKATPKKAAAKKPVAKKAPVKKAVAKKVVAKKPAAKKAAAPAKKAVAKVRGPKQVPSMTARRRPRVLAGR